MSINIFTDGSSKGNPGPGGWAFIIKSDEQVFEMGGREEHTTNNRMELMAVIQSLEWVKSHELLSKKIFVNSDSKYVIKGITEWVFNWQKNGWRTAARKPVENKDLWEKLVLVVSGLSIDWRYVEGHSGHIENERCDEIATAFADNRDIKLL